MLENATAASATSSAYGAISVKAFATLTKLLMLLIILSALKSSIFESFSIETEIIKNAPLIISANPPIIPSIGTATENIGAIDTANALTPAIAIMYADNATPKAVIAA